MDHVYEKVSGRVVASFIEGQDLSHYDSEIYGVANKPGRVDGRAIYLYQDGALALKPVATLTADKLIITADGEDRATVTVTVESVQDLAGLVVAAEGVEGSVDLVDGAASFPVTAGASGTIEIEVTDERVYSPEGLTITAE